MKFYNVLFLTLFTSGLALAAPPKNHRSDRYKDLYLRSAITDPPPEIVKDDIPNDLPDWVLVGVTKYIGKTEIEIMNIKDRSRITIPSKEASDQGFTVKEVVQDRNYLDHTVVTIQKGKVTGEVRFDRKFLVLKKIGGSAGATARRPSTGGRTVTSKTGTRQQPPTPGRTTTSRTRTGGAAAPTRAGAVPRPTTATNGATGTAAGSTTTNSTTTRSKRTRYVPRPQQ